MQSGILSIYHEKTEKAGRQDHYFVSGGMCLVHPNAQLEISCPEACLLSDIDPKVMNIIFDTNYILYVLS